MGDIKGGGGDFFPEHTLMMHSSCKIHVKWRKLDILNMEVCIFCTYSNELLKWPLSSGAGCIKWKINSELTLILLNYLNIWPYSVTQLFHFSSCSEWFFLKSLAVFSWTVCSSVCWPFDVITMMVREHWDWKLDMKKWGDGQNKDCLSLAERLNGNTLSWWELGF